MPDGGCIYLDWLLSPPADPKGLVVVSPGLSAGIESASHTPPHPPPTHVHRFSLIGFASLASLPRP